MEKRADLQSDGPAKAYAAIVRFLERGREPALLEPGEMQFALRPDCYTLDWRNGRLTMQVWDERRNLARRIVGVGEERAGKLELTIERFGKQQGRIYLLETGRGRAGVERLSSRLVFREQFRRSLSRQFPDWKIAELSTDANLEESLSPSYPRALLKRGTTGIAAMAAPPEPGAASASLTFALIWLDYLRRRERRMTIESLALFLPESEARQACHRLPFLDPKAARVQAYVYSEQGYEEWIDPHDYGNLDTRLEPCATLPVPLPPQVACWVERLRALPGVDATFRADGGVSLRVHGLEFARANRGELLFGLEKRAAARDSNIAEVEQLAREIARLRSPSAADRENPLYRQQPEAWLEAEVRARLERVDASLVAGQVYGQVPALSGGDRGIIDLLAADHSGRLAVLELKASEDIHLPLQALDYWIRVVWHLERGEFEEYGYFPGRSMAQARPRLLLVAPALCFHPKTEAVLRFFAPTIEVERIGLGADWRRGPKVMFRIRGAERPL
jgi:hypothetical protein